MALGLRSDGRLPPVKVVRMLAVRDEADILDANLRWYAERDIATVALDDGSTDGSAEMLRRAVDAGLVSRSEKFDGAERDWGGVLAHVQEMAAAERPEIVLLASADEFFEVGDGSDLVAALEEDVRAGYTVFDFKNMEFHPTEADDPGQADVTARMRYYAHRDVGMQRGLLWAPGIDYSRHLGHLPILPPGFPRRVSPRLYVSRHYPIRSPEQIEQKMTRIRPSPHRPNASTHYLRLMYGEDGILVPTDVLSRYEEDHRWVLEEETALRWRLRQTTVALSRAHLRIEELEAGR